jgi:hypothetical protein
MTMPDCALLLVSWRAATVVGTPTISLVLVILGALACGRSKAQEENCVRTSSKISTVLFVACVVTLSTGLGRAQPFAPSPSGTAAGSAEGSAATSDAGSSTPDSTPHADTSPAPTETKPTEGAGPKISGFIDTTYNYNINRPASGKNTYFSYAAQQNNLSLNTADVALSGSIQDTLSYYVQVDMGADATVDAYAYGFPTIFDIQEAYVQYTSRKNGVSRLAHSLRTMVSK